MAMQILPNKPTGEHNDLPAEHIKKYAQHFDEDALVITELKPAVRNRARVNVFVDDKYEFSLTLEQIVDLGIKVGKRVTVEELEELRAASELEKLYQQTLEWSLVRPRSMKETRDYLVRKQRTRQMAAVRWENFQRKMQNDVEYRERVKELRERTRETNRQLSARRAQGLESGPDYLEDNRFEYRGRARTNLPTKPASAITNKQIEQVIEKLVQMRALDDKKFAQWFVENRMVNKGVSKRRLQLELVKKGLEKDVIAQALGESERTELEEAQKIVAKKWGRYETEEKLIQYLVRQGFDWETARAAVRSYDHGKD